MPTLLVDANLRRERYANAKCAILPKLTIDKRFHQMLI
jgi:hypothetical protein